MDEISVITTPKDNHTNDFIGATEVLANNEQPPHCSKTTWLYNLSQNFGCGSKP
jgi:hypothetical protein